MNKEQKTKLDLQILKKGLQNYKLSIKQSAIDYLASLIEKERKMIIKKIISSINSSKVLPKLKGPLKNHYKIKIGNHRVIVVIKFNQNEIEIMYIGNRKSVYREFKRKL